MERTAATELLTTLADGVADLTNSTAWRAWLDVQRRFHRYSWGNTLLIAAQRPDATRIAGFHAWLRLDRHVRKGEHGIAILASVVPRLRVVDGESGDERWVAGRPHAFRPSATERVPSRKLVHRARSRSLIGCKVAGGGASAGNHHPAKGRSEECQALSAVTTTPRPVRTG
jgi:hypothetical protein